MATALRQNGYKIHHTKQNVAIATLYGVAHTPDWIAYRGNDEFIVEVKYQGSSGSLYPKTLGEVVRLSLSMAKNPGRFKSAYIVLTGEAINKETGKPDAGYHSFKQWMFLGFYRDVVRGSDRIHCVSLDKFMDLCNKGAL